MFKIYEILFGNRSFLKNLILYTLFFLFLDVIINIFFANSYLKFSSYLVTDTFIAEKSSLIIPLNSNAFIMSLVNFSLRAIIYFQLCFGGAESIFNKTKNYMQFLQIFFIFLCLFFFFASIIDIFLIIFFFKSDIYLFPESISKWLNLELLLVLILCTTTFFFKQRKYNKQIQQNNNYNHDSINNQY